MVMKPIASTYGIEICAKKGQAYSFFSSPYQAHRDYSAVDIHASSEFGNEVASPVGGIVQKTLSFDSPTPTERSLPEHLIIIKKGDYAARIMHVEPAVKTGEKISPGDVLGRTVTNGFFSYWTDPTIHVEIRKQGDFLRAKGGLELKPCEEKKANGKQSSKMQGVVTHACSRNLTVKLEDRVIGRVGETPVILDGTTNLDYAGLYGKFQAGEPVYLNETLLGIIRSTGNYMSIYSTAPTQAYANDIAFEGIIFSSDATQVKLLLKDYGKQCLSPGEKVHIKLENI